MADQGPPARGLGLPSAPVYHPTEEQFLDPLAFIASIRPEAERYGLCRIIPPPSWRPPFAVDTKTFTFDTRIQCVSELQHKLSSKPDYKAWEARYQDFLRAAGKGKRRNPTLNGREIELYKFHKLVEKRGGYAACCERKLWREVARLLGVRAPPASSSWRAGLLGRGAARRVALQRDAVRPRMPAYRSRPSVASAQVPASGSNLAYGVRCLYAKQLEPFDAWLAGARKPQPPNHESHQSNAEAPAATGAAADAEAEEAAAILESLQHRPDGPAAAAPTALGSPLAAQKRRDSLSSDRPAAKVRRALQVRRAPPAPRLPVCARRCAARPCGRRVFRAALREP